MVRQSFSPSDHDNIPRWVMTLDKMKSKKAAGYPDVIACCMKQTFLSRV
jgi:hypothetical protein